jgi:bis(5'-adenosyl)-triphosphatase
MNSEHKCPFDGNGTLFTEYAGNEHFAALYNVAPILPGHSLLIPRRHVERFLDLKDNEFFAFLLFARQLTSFLVKQFNAEGFDWSIQDGRAAGQTILHVHLHVILRWHGDLPSPGNWYDRLELPVSSYADAAMDSDSRPRLSPPELSRVVNKLSAEAEAYHLVARSRRL